MQRENLSTRINKLLPDLLVIILLAAALLYLAMVPPAELGFGRDICLIKSITHRACPGCGMTRAFSALLHGDLQQAIQFNPFIIIVAPILAYLITQKISRFVSAVLSLSSFQPGTKVPNN